MLKAIEYSVNATRKNDPWVLDEIVFNNFNIVVGINSTGKSRMITVINGLALFIRNSGLNYLGQWKAVFDFNGKLFNYELNSQADGNLTESLYIDEVLVMERKNDLVRLLSKATNQWDQFSPPLESLVVHVRRDKLAYPYLEELHKWAENVKFFEFGHLHSYDFNSVKPNRKETISIDNIAKILAEDVSEHAKGRIIDNFNKLGYNIVGLKAETIGGVFKILIKEDGFLNYIQQNQMSQGMIRSLAVIIFIEYLIESKKESLVLIDDLAEGLDNQRAALLGDYINSSSKGLLQVITTSNHDYFLNNTNVESWIILYRKGINVKAIFSIKYPEIFRKFKMSGLEPFDLFTTGFIKKYLNDEDIDIR